MTTKKRKTVNEKLFCFLCLFVAHIAGIISCGRAAPETANAPATNKSYPEAQMKTLQFSGYDWLVKSGDQRMGPGPNYFSDSADNVFIDAQGQLHLRITEREGRWFCAEVISRSSFGYGTYRFHLNTKAESVDPLAILGMFTWSDEAAYAHRELDIEISRWGQADNQNAQFVVQPYTRPENIVRFQMPPALSSSVHSFSWKPDSVHFQSTANSTSGQVIQQHTFTKDIPRAGGENARINLWLFAGRPPTTGKPIEIVISKFEFTPSVNH